MKYIFLALFIIVCIPSAAQNTDSLGSTPKLAVRWTPFALTNRFSAVLLGIEYRPAGSNPRWTFAHDVGLVLKGGQGTESFSNKNGFKALTEVRYYLESKGRAPIYVAGEVYFHQINYDRTELIGYDCEFGECSYWQYSSWRRTYTMQRYALKIGVVTYLGGGKNFYFDFAAGVGYRIRRSKDRNKPPIATNGTNFGADEGGWLEAYFIEDQEIWGPVFSLKFGYTIK